MTIAALFPHVLKLEQLFKPNKLERCHWEKMVAREKVKVWSYVFDGSSVECLLFCAMHALEMFRDMLFYLPMVWYAKWSKYLRGNEKEIY